jgi:hypothetical protein
MTRHALPSDFQHVLDPPLALSGAGAGVSLDDLVADTPAFVAAELREARRGYETALINGVRVGTLAGLDQPGLAMVNFPENPAGEPISARSTLNLSPEDLGRPAVLMFEEGSPARPIILGLLENEREAQAAPIGEEPTADTVEFDSPLWIEADGQRVVVEAQEELVLRCGKASITLTKAGKVLIRGAYVSSRSSGVNRIKGGSVQIN